MYRGSSLKILKINVNSTNDEIVTLWYIIMNKMATFSMRPNIKANLGEYFMNLK
jgi:hypothetical protein